MKIEITRIEADLIIAGLHDLEVKVPESKSSFLLANYEKIEPLYEAIRKELQRTNEKGWFAKCK